VVAFCLSNLIKKGHSPDDVQLGGEGDTPLLLPTEQWTVHSWIQGGGEAC